MIPSFRFLLLAFASAGCISGLSLSDISDDTPVADIVAAAISSLSAGSNSEAISFFDAAISRNPNDHITIFKRGSTQMTFGRFPQALHDFDRVLRLRPTFDPALIHRASIHLHHGDWDAAERDYVEAGMRDDSDELLSLEAARVASKQSEQAEDNKDWTACIDLTSTALQHATRLSPVRQRRIRCQLNQSDYSGAVADLHFLTSRNPTPDLLLQSSIILYYGLNERKSGVGKIRTCLQSDPDSKQCMPIFKSQKALDRDLDKVEKFRSNRKFNNAAVALVGNSATTNTILQVENTIKGFIEKGHLPKNAVQESHILLHLNSLACELYVESNLLKKSQKYCDAALARDPANLYAILSKANQQIDAEQFEAALSTLQTEGLDRNHPKVASLANSAREKLRISKQKDYYKVLNVDRDATAQQIKTAYRRVSKEFHPDRLPADQRAGGDKKMAEINEAYQVLSSPELRARFDNGDDPNDPTGGAGHGGRPGGNPFQGGGGPHFQFFNGGGQPGGGGAGQQFHFFNGGGPGGQQKAGGQPPPFNFGGDFRFGG